jgi:hypothetical protein
MSIRTRLFLILSLAGIAGVVSLLLIDLTSLIALIPDLGGSEIPTITLSFSLLSLVQPIIILELAVLAGVVLAHKVRLSAPVAEALASRSDALSALKPQIVPGLLGGLVGGVSIVLVSLLFKPSLQADVVARISEFVKLLPLPTRVLYGGITEELLLRWGLMTLLVWLAWRLLQKGQGTPKSICYVVAILLSALVFGIGHLPVTYMLFSEPTVSLILFVVIANSTFGLVAGYLYWKKGLESAIIAHVFGHIVLAVASYAGAYF